MNQEQRMAINCIILRQNSWQNKTKFPLHGSMIHIVRKYNTHFNEMPNLTIMYSVASKNFQQSQGIFQIAGTQVKPSIFTSQPFPYQNGIQLLQKRKQTIPYVIVRYVKPSISTWAWLFQGHARSHWHPFKSHSLQETYQHHNNLDQNCLLKLTLSLNILSISLSQTWLSKHQNHNWSKSFVALSGLNRKGTSSRKWSNPYKLEWMKMGIQ